MWAGMPLSAIARLHPSASIVPSLPRWSYASRVSTWVSAARPTADDSGLPLNVPCCAAPFVTCSMIARVAAEGADRRTAADRLGPRGQVRHHAEALGRAAVGDRAAALDLVEDQDRAVLARTRP